jgi:hypothetical protein
VWEYSDSPPFFINGDSVLLILRQLVNLRENNRRGQSRMDNPETLAVFEIEEKEQIQTRQKTKNKKTHYSSYFICKTCKWNENHNNKQLNCFLII